MKTCKDCYFFDQDSPRAKISSKMGRYYGMCKRHSPTINLWPVVHDEDWCGELSEKHIVLPVVDKKDLKRVKEGLE